MAEQELDIIENGEYFNINLKDKVKKGLKGLGDGNHVVVKKIYAGGYRVVSQYGVSYSCKVTYKDKEVSFWLNEDEHNIYKDIGGEGDNVKISMRKIIGKRKDGTDFLKSELVFELA